MARFSHPIRHAKDSRPDLGTKKAWHLQEEDGDDELYAVMVARAGDFIGRVHLRLRNLMKARICPVLG